MPRAHDISRLSIEPFRSNLIAMTATVSSQYASSKPIAVPTDGKKIRHKAVVGNTDPIASRVAKNNVSLCCTAHAGGRTIDENYELVLMPQP